MAPARAAAHLEPVTTRRTHYDVLGVPPDATMDDIKKAYRRASRTLHPDMNDGVQSPEWFLVADAYRILSDEGTRARYDTILRAFATAAATAAAAATEPPPPQRDTRPRRPAEQRPVHAWMVNLDGIESPPEQVIIRQRRRIITPGGRTAAALGYTLIGVAAGLLAGAAMTDAPDPIRYQDAATVGALSLTVTGVAHTDWWPVTVATAGVWASTIANLWGASAFIPFYTATFLIGVGLIWNAWNDAI